jgi:hypothetical protein
MMKTKKQEQERRNGMERDLGKRGGIEQKGWILGWGRHSVKLKFHSHPT